MSGIAGRCSEDAPESLVGEDESLRVATGDVYTVSGKCGLARCTAGSTTRTHKQANADVFFLFFLDVM